MRRTVGLRRIFKPMHQHVLPEAQPITVNITATLLTDIRGLMGPAASPLFTSSKQQAVGTEDKEAAFAV